MVNMNTTRRGPFCRRPASACCWRRWSGCQTQIPGTQQTLPSPHYLEHPPQYIPPSPAFPLAREEATQAAINARRRRAARAGAAPGPSPVPGGQ